MNSSSPRKIHPHILHVFRHNIFSQCCSMYGLSPLTDKKHVFSHLKCLVAVSGGSDSIGLLALFAALRQEFPSIALGVGYVNHGMQPKTLQIEEEDVVRSACATLHMTLWPTKIADLTTHITDSAPGHTVHSEDVLRKLRYDALIALAQEHHCNCIATAHHADDEFETIIMRLFQGRSSLGIRGIPCIRKLNSNLFLIRPCLPLTNEYGQKDAKTRSSEFSQYITSETLQHIAVTHALSYHTDPHNTTLAPHDSKNYLRSEIRSHLVPHIKKIFPKAIEKTILMNKETQSMIEEVSHGRQDTMWTVDSIGVCNTPRLSIRLDTFVHLRKSKKKHMLFYAMNTLGVSNITESFIAPLINLTLPLSGDMLKFFYIKNVAIVVSHSHLIVHARTAEPHASLSLQELPLHIDTPRHNTTNTCILKSVNATYYNRIVVDISVDAHMPSKPSSHGIQSHGLVYYFLADTPIFIDWISKHDTIQQQGKPINIRSVLQSAMYKNYWREIPVIRTQKHILVAMGEVLHAPTLFQDNVQTTIHALKSTNTTRDARAYTLHISYEHILLTQYQGEMHITAP